MSDDEPDETGGTPSGVSPFSDAVAPYHTIDDDFEQEFHYRRGETGVESNREEESATDVDPRGLFPTVTLDEIRWYYRNGDIASTIVDKPVADAFKYGFQFSGGGDGASERIRTVMDRCDYLDSLKASHKKARRDGFCLLFVGTEDENEIYQPPKNVQNVTHTHPITVEELNGRADVSAVGDSWVAQRLDGYDETDITIRDSGMVVSDDLMDERYNKPVAYIYYPRYLDDVTPDEAQLIHHERVKHIAYRTEVDGRVFADTFGTYEGDSVLQPIIHTLRVLHKSKWAAGQTLFRHSAPLHKGMAPAGAGEDEFDQFDEEMSNINSKSAFTLPDGYDVEAIETGEGVDPEPYFDAIFNLICAGTEFTRPVLFGTQTGTVSGSETDIKNYFNQVQRLRQNEFTPDILWFVETVNDWNKQLMPNTTAGVEIEWEPIFRVDELNKVEALSRVLEVASVGVKNYILTPTEARQFVQQRFDQRDIEMALDELSEDEFDELDRVALRTQGNAGGDDENDTDAGESPRANQNGGGRNGGNTTDPSTPTGDSIHDE